MKTLLIFNFFSIFMILFAFNTNIHKKDICNKMKSKNQMFYKKFCKENNNSNDSGTLKKVRGIKIFR